MTKARWTMTCAAVVLAGCSGGAADAPAETTASVTVQAPQRRAMVDVVDAYGIVAFPPEHLHTISADGEVRAAQVLVSAGESVLAGQPLLRLAATPNSAVELAKARSDDIAATAELARIQRLKRQQLATNSELATATQARNVAAASLASLQRRNGGTSGVVRANSAGIVASVDVQQGDVVTAGGALIHLADNGELRIRLGVEPADMARMHEGQPVTISPVYAPTARLPGRISKVVRQLDPQTRLGEALVDVSPDAALLAGASVRATIEVDRRAGALAVPHDAILLSDDRCYVFVVAAGHARKAWIERGGESDGFVEVVKGLKAEDRVVVQGNYELEDGMAVTVGNAP
jgi:membrane fusion protein, multidrug efflux system